MSAARTERLLNLLTLLINTRRPIALREIRELDEFRAYCSDDPKSGERAFERDKAALIELGVPLRWVPPESEEAEDDLGLGGYMIDRESYYLPELALTPGELALLSMAGAAALAIARSYTSR
jgi:proteasome accessory factor B